MNRGTTHRSPTNQARARRVWSTLLLNKLSRCPGGDASARDAGAFSRHELRRPKGADDNRRSRPQTKRPRRFAASGAGAFGAPSAWLFLVRLHACRAGLRFTRRPTLARACPASKPRSASSLTCHCHPSGDGRPLLLRLVIHAGLMGGPASTFPSLKETVHD